MTNMYWIHTSSVLDTFVNMALFWSWLLATVLWDEYSDISDVIDISTGHDLRAGSLNTA